MKSPLNSSAIVKYTPTADPQFKKTEEKKSKNLDAVSKFGKDLLKLFQKREKDNIKNDLDNKKELERQRALAEERKSEQKKAGGNILRSTLKKAGDIIGGLKDLILGLVAYKILDWISNPKNFEQVKGLIIAVKGIFDFIGATINFGVTNLMEGISQLTTGSILERFFGLVKVLAGFFVLRWLLNPFKLIKDLGRLVRFIPKIKRLFSFLGNVGKKGILPALKDALKAAGAAKGLTAKSISKVVRRSLLRILGKGGFKALTAGLSKGGGAVAKALYKASGGVIKGGVKKSATRLGLKLLGKGGLKTAGKIFSKIPIIGGLLDFGINVALGDPVDKAAVKAVGATLGGALGGLIGSVIPGPGTIVGSILGGLLGDFLADKAYGFFKGISNSAGKKQAEGKDKIPGLATGGIVTKPTLAHLAEDEPEVVIPLSKVGPGSVVDSIIGRPFKIIGRAFLGGLMGMVGALGPLGFALQPLIKSLLGPFIKDYGVSKVPAKKLAKGPTTSNLKMQSLKGGDDQSSQLSKLIGTQPRQNGTDVLSLLSRIKDNIGKMIGGTVGGGGSGGGGGGNTNGSTQLPSGPAGPYEESLAKLLANYEGIRTKAYKDAVGIPTIGIGATYYPKGFRLSGRVQMGQSITKEEAYWIKAQHIKDHRNRLLKEISSGEYNSLPDSVKAALESKVFNYGSLGGALANLVKQAVKSKDYKSIANYFRTTLAAHNGGLNSWRRNDEAKIIESGKSNRVSSVSFKTAASGGKINLLAENAKTTYYDPSLGGINASGYKTKDGLPATSTGEGYRPTIFSAAAFPPLIAKLPSSNLARSAGFPGGKTLKTPLNVVVTNSKGKRGVVRVNDVGPGVAGHASNHMLDLSVAAKNYFGTGGGFKIEGPTSEKPGPLDGNSMPAAASSSDSSSSSGNQTAASSESSQADNFLGADPTKLAQDLGSLFSILTGAPNPNKGPSTTTLSSDKLKGITNTAFGKGPEIQKLSDDFSKYYETTGVGTVVFNQPPIIVNNATLNTTVAFSPDTNLAEKSLNLSRRL